VISLLEGTEGLAFMGTFLLLTRSAVRLALQPLTVAAVALPHPRGARDDEREGQRVG
jgi:hypothetical protein